MPKLKITTNSKGKHAALIQKGSNHKRVWTKGDYFNFIFFNYIFKLRAQHVHFKCLRLTVN